MLRLRLSTATLRVRALTTRRSSFVPFALTFAVGSACQPPPAEHAPAPSPPTAGAALPLVSAAPPAASSEASAPPSTNLTFSSTIPKDLPPNPTSADAATFAWQSFVGVNWPALSGARGVPDPNKTIGNPGDVVWYTYKAPDEIFYADGSAPPDWNTYGGTLPPQCSTGGATAGVALLTRLTKVPANTGNAAVELAKQAVGGTLTDQHQNLVHYEVRMNQTIFEEIVSKQYYNVQGQQAAPYISFPNQVMELKAAWRQFTSADSPAVRARYARRQVWIYTPPLGPKPATCVQGEVGLVGLHITQKTPSRPQWTWATFEQVDNVPPFGAPTQPGPVPYSFNDPACSVTQCPPNQSTEKNGVPTGVPTQVTRVVNIGAAAPQANALWQSALGSTVYRYYELVDIQYPSNPQQLPGGNPTPGLVANTTMETYVPQSSCMNCHFTARTQSGKLSSDYSFMLAEAHPAQPKPANIAPKKVLP